MKPVRSAPKASPAEAPKSDKRTSQSDMPSLSLERVLPIAQAIWDNFAGASAQPHDIAVSIGTSPTSSHWRLVTGASIAYGLTEGGYNSQEIHLTELGRQAVAPQEEGESASALAEAAKKPSIPKKFIERYDRKKLPAPDIGANVMVSLGLPKDKAAQAFEVLTQNLKFAHLILVTKTGPLVVANPGPRSAVAEQSDNASAEALVEDSASESAPTAPLAKPIARTTPAAGSNRVFISHGSDRQMVEQLKKAIRIARLEPIVSVERETTAKPVPEKVFGDMRSCFAGIIHVGHEGKWKDDSGNEVARINENVLIEIGAAMALYGKNIILLVDRSVRLPSNLQGLYRCEYEGKELSADALFKVLEAVSSFNPDGEPLGS